MALELHCTCAQPLPASKIKQHGSVEHGVIVYIVFPVVMVPTVWNMRGYPLPLFLLCFCCLTFRLIIRFNYTCHFQDYGGVNRLSLKAVQLLCRFEAIWINNEILVWIHSVDTFIFVYKNCKLIYIFNVLDYAAVKMVNCYLTTSHMACGVFGTLRGLISYEMVVYGTISVMHFI